MRRALGEDREFERQWRRRDQVEAAIGVIGREQPVETQYRGQQRRYPDRSAGDAAQQFRLGPDREWKQHDDEHEKPENDADVAALAPGEPQLVPNQAEKCAHQPASKAPGITANASSAKLAAPSIAIG